MKHAYIIELYYEDRIHFIMPYLFTSEKDAYLYGEYAYRINAKLKSYKVERIKKTSKFYALKAK